MPTRRTFAAASLAMASALVLGACSSQAAPENSASGSPSASQPAESHYPVTVTDMAGNEVTIESADSVAITDNRFFQLAVDWGVPVTAAPLDLMSPKNPLKENTDVFNIGTHREPDFGQVVKASPDLIINGHRFAERGQDMQKAAPKAALVDMTAEDLSPEEYVKKSVTLMGEIFNKKEEAAAVISDFEAAIKNAKDAYDPATKVMGLVTTGKDINYANPEDGRGASVYFNLLGLTPALEASGSSGHTGDDISIEAIGEAKADFFLVLDRAAAVSNGADNTGALELIKGSSALAKVPAVTNDAIYVMPSDYYLTEDVHAYIEVLGGLTESFKKLG